MITVSPAARAPARAIHAGGHAHRAGIGGERRVIEADRLEMGLATARREAVEREAKRRERDGQVVELPEDGDEAGDRIDR